MKKVAILTINDDNNYGNRLQNYALQETLKKMNVVVETIENKKGVYGFRYIIRKVKNYIKIKIPLKMVNERTKTFLKFNRDNIKYSKIGIDENHIHKNINEKYDCFFTGSDQVWNPTFDRMSDIDFLTFAEKRKRNSFSASFGINNIPDNMKHYYKEKLMQFNNISVREDRGKEIVEELTGRKDVEVLLDPTFLLTAEEWDKIAQKPKMLRNNKYILNYFLGNLSEKRRRKIEKIAKENNCEIINLLDKQSPFYNSGPSEFLYLEKNAFLICTDSFHSSVFSIIFNRPFVIFDREDKLQNMNSRLETLLRKLNLYDRKCNDNLSNESLIYDYSNAYKIIDKEKEKANAFIKRILNETNNAT